MIEPDCPRIKLITLPEDTKEWGFTWSAHAIAFAVDAEEAPIVNISVKHIRMFSLERRYGGKWSLRVMVTAESAFGEVWIECPNYGKAKQVYDFFDNTYQAALNVRHAAQTNATA